MEATRYPNIVARMYREGHLIGNHSYFHPSFTTLCRQKIIDEINNTSTSIEAATGSRPRVLRPPFGARNTTVLDVAQELDMPVILWSIDPRDWLFRDAVLVRDHILERAVNGSVILMHDIHESSVEAAIMVIDALTKRGYTFVTVEELFTMNALEMQAGQVYRSVYHHNAGGSE